MAIVEEITKFLTENNCKRQRKFTFFSWKPVYNKSVRNCKGNWEVHSAKWALGMYGVSSATDPYA